MTREEREEAKQLKKKILDKLDGRKMNYFIENYCLDLGVTDAYIYNQLNGYQPIIPGLKEVIRNFLNS